MAAALRMAELLEPLTTEAGRRFIRVQVGADPLQTPAELLLPILLDPAFDRGEYVTPESPTTVPELARALAELSVTVAQIVPFLVHTCTTDLAYGATRGPWSIKTAQTVLECVVHTLGARTRWWTIVAYPAWCWEHGDFSTGFMSNPVTGHDFDRAVVGIGDNATVTLLAFADS
ncbi:hypothetical protein ACFYTC_35775 [Actinomadura nitritigenes]|uniref:hypothetical protein n=1 Tax=Actinomadura nitritigenes TaxID=134602 RepID=UPI00368300CB